MNKQESFSFLSHSFQLDNTPLTHEPRTIKARLANQTVNIWSQRDAETDRRVKEGGVFLSRGTNEALKQFFSFFGLCV